MKYHVVEARHFRAHTVWLRFRDGTAGEIDLAPALRGPKREFVFRIDHVDITQDPRLFSRYRERIPVVVLDGQEVAWGIVTIPALRAALVARHGNDRGEAHGVSP